MANFLNWVKSHLNLAVVLGVGVPCLLAAGIVVAVDRASYAAYEAEYEKQAEELRATFPALPKGAVIDNDFLTYNADGSDVSSSKSSYTKSFLYYARDAVVAPLSEQVAQEYVKTDDSMLGEYITGLDRRGGAITFTFRTPSHGYADIAIAMKTNWVDTDGVYHELSNITDYINIQTNGLDVKTENLKLTVSDDFQHLVLKDAFLLKGENTLTFATNAYNTFGNKDSILYIMPNIRNVALLTDVDVYEPVFDYDLADFPTTYRLVENPDLSKIKITKKIGDPEISYAEEEFDGSKVTSIVDFDSAKITLKPSPKVIKEIPFTIDSSAENNTIRGEIDGKPIEIVVTSRTSANISYEGASAVANISLSGKKGFARVALNGKVSGDDAAYDALPASFGMELRDNNLILITANYYMSTTKANSNTNGGTSQSGNTYFAITNEEYLTAFWNWTYSGDECLALKCTYTINEAETSITLNSCLAYTRNEWQYLTSKTFNVTAISALDVPETLSSRLTLY